MSNYNFDFDGKILKISLERINDLKKLDQKRRQDVGPEISQLLTNCWGSFPSNFVDKHIFGADKMIIARVDNILVGICVMSIKFVDGLKIHYIEFLLVSKEFQRAGLGSFLSFRILRDEIISNFFEIIFGKSLEIFFITPNIRVLSHAARFANFIYPNPYLSNDYGEVELADERTWDIAKKLLKNSDNPNRNLSREGLVITDSYADTPWLIYNNDNAPWHYDYKINIFAKKYLGYHNGQDKEFMVRMNIDLLSIFKYLFKK